MLQPFLDDIEALFQNIKADYCTGTGADFGTSLKDSMRRESAAILRLIFDHYSEDTLLICRSTGSSLEHYFDEIIQNKIRENISFFHNVGYTNMDDKLLGLLISAQFDSYRRIVAKCSDHENAEKYMDALMAYHLGGWIALFNSII